MESTKSQPRKTFSPSPLRSHVPRECIDCAARLGCRVWAYPQSLATMVDSSLAVEFPELAAHTLLVSIPRLQAVKQQIERFPLRSSWHPVDIVCRYGRARPHTLQYPLSSSSENARERALQLNRYIQDGFVPSGEEAGFRSFYPASELFRAEAVFPPPP